MSVYLPFVRSKTVVDYTYPAQTCATMHKFCTNNHESPVLLVVSMEVGEKTNS